MALIGVDTYTPTPGVTGASATASTQTASTQANPATNAATTAGNTTTAPQTGPQPLNTSGPLGTTVNVVA